MGPGRSMSLLCLGPVPPKPLIGCTSPRHRGMPFCRGLKIVVNFGPRPGGAVVRCVGGPGLPCTPADIEADGPAGEFPGDKGRHRQQHDVNRGEAAAPTTAGHPAALHRASRVDPGDGGCSTRGLGSRPPVRRHRVQERRGREAPVRGGPVTGRDRRRGHSAPAHGPRSRRNGGQPRRRPTRRRCRQRAQVGCSGPCPGGSFSRHDEHVSVRSPPFPSRYSSKSNPSVLLLHLRVGFCVRKCAHHMRCIPRWVQSSQRWCGHTFCYEQGV
jgi:hypothetical protein